MAAAHPADAEPTGTILGLFAVHLNPALNPLFDGNRCRCHGHDSLLGACSNGQDNWQDGIIRVRYCQQCSGLLGPTRRAFTGKEGIP